MSTIRPTTAPIQSALGLNCVVCKVAFETRQDAAAHTSVQHQVAPVVFKGQFRHNV